MPDDSRELFCFMVGMQFGEYLAHLPPDDPREEVMPTIIAKHLGMQPSNVEMAHEAHELFNLCIDEAFNELGCCAAKLPLCREGCCYERCYNPRTQKSFLCRSHQKEVMSAIPTRALTPLKHHVRKKVQPKTKRASSKKTTRRATAPRAGKGT